LLAKSVLILIHEVVINKEFIAKYKYILIPELNFVFIFLMLCLHSF